VKKIAPPFLYYMRNSAKRHEQARSAASAFAERLRVCEIFCVAIAEQKIWVK
jgi:hypothetical protein